MAFIKVEGSASGNSFLAEQRKKQLITLPPFSFGGEPSEGSESGRFFPRFGIDLESVVVSSRTAGSGVSTFGFKRKAIHNINDGEWEFWSASLAANQKYYTASLTQTFGFDANDWLSVECTAAGGHEGITVVFIATESSLGYVDL